MSDGFNIGNREYKDRLFSFIFGNSEHREWTLSLYNAVNGTQYDDPDLIRINTIKEVLYLSMHNDVSFILSDVLSLYEQQSTFNPNMPLRMLQYAGNIYDGYCRENGLNKYSEVVLPLPVPKLVVFYNGLRREPEERILNLADSFAGPAESDIQVRVRMLNINSGSNAEILGRCEPLNEYSLFVEDVRSRKAEGTLERAIDEALRLMPDDFVLKPFLEEHQAEVKGMLLTEYNEQEQMELFKRDYLKQGEAIGEARGQARGEAKGRELMGELFNYLSDQNRIEDFKRATRDSEYCEQLLKQSGLIK